MTIDQAAAALGVSREAVRLRIRRGTLRGEHAASGWLVWLVDTQPTSDRPTRQKAPLPSADRDHLLEEIARLAAALERSQQGEAELRRLLGNSQQQLGIAQSAAKFLTTDTDVPTAAPTMPVTPSAPPESPNTSPTPRRPLRERIRQLFDRR